MALKKGWFVKNSIAKTIRNFIAQHDFSEYDAKYLAEYFGKISPEKFAEELIDELESLGMLGVSHKDKEEKVKAYIRKNALKLLELMKKRVEEL